MIKRRFVQVGVGGRGEMFSLAITGKYAASCELLALCDVNEGRLKMRAQEIESAVPYKVKTYPAEQFERMIAEIKPDCVIVTCIDKYHDDYICRAMELGCDVITEKPMTIDEQRCQRIVDTQRRTGRKCIVTFNYRYAPARTHVKELLMSGVIGRVLSLDFQYLLDTNHGADYFRRWHRNKANSGGLMVHKSTHHFDIINWWLSSIPASVYAEGRRAFYTPEQAKLYGLKNRGTRCSNCVEVEKCPFQMKFSEHPFAAKLYQSNEKYDGYFRDQCVFSPEIDIEDSMNLVVRYQNGVLMTYCLNAFTPWEGFRVAINGTKGRLEHSWEETVASKTGQIPGAGEQITVFPHFAPHYSVEPWKGEGLHGGGDVKLLEHIFNPESIREDKYMHAADYRAGAYSILTGVAANRSMATGQAVRLDSLIKNVDLPEFPAMP